jgi:hypothetical protein
MQFTNFTLNISGILLSETPDGLPCPQIFDEFDKEVEIAIYARGVRKLKSRTVYNYTGCRTSEFEEFAFYRYYDYSNGAIDRYLKSLNVV